MAKTPDTVSSFLLDLSEQLNPLHAAERQVMLDLKKVCPAVLVF
jgi:hypothetical protein